MALGFSAVFVALSLWLLPRLKGRLRRAAVGQADARLRRRGRPCRLGRRPPAGPRRRHGHPGAPRPPTAPRCSWASAAAGAAFMPDKFVFPGGAVDPEDGLLPGEPPLDPLTARRLAEDAAPELVPRLAFAAVRELWEETGLMLGLPDPGARRPSQCRPPGATSTPRACVPEPGGAPLRLPRRHAARPAAALRRPLLPRRGAARSAGDDLDRLGRELAHLQWLTLAGRPGAAACPSSPRWCSPRSRRSSPTPTRRGRCPSSTRRPEGRRFRLL